MEFKWQALYDRKRYFRPSYDPWGQNKNAHLQDMHNHNLEYQLSTPENLDVVQVINFAEKWKRRFSTLIWPLGIIWKFKNLIAHLKDMPNQILEYNLAMTDFKWQKNSL